MYEFWYDYANSKYGRKPKLCYIATEMLLTKILQKMLKQDLTLEIMN